MQGEYFLYPTDENEIEGGYVFDFLIRGWEVEKWKMITG